MVPIGHQGIGMAAAGGTKKILDFSNDGVRASLCMAFAAFFLLAGYEFIRSSASALFLQDFGKDAIPVATLYMPFAVVAFLYIYGRMLGRWGAKWTLVATTLGSGGLIALGFVLHKSGVRLASAVLYVLREAYVVLIIEQYWSYINSKVSRDVARRLNGPVCGISSLGAIAGGLITAKVVGSIGTVNMLAFAALACLPAAVFSWLAFRIGGDPRGQTHEARPVGHPGKANWMDVVGLSLLRREPVLAWIMAIVLTTQVVAAMTDFAFQGALNDAISSTDDRTAYLGGFFARLNIFALALQFVLAPVLLSWFRYEWINIAIPAVQLITCAAAVMEPSLASTGIAFMTFKMLDYSLFRATKEILYIPLSFDARYRSKELIDVFGYRFGKGGAALAVTGAISLGAVFTSQWYAALALGAVSFWLFLVTRAIGLFRRHNQPIGPAGSAG
ncbi:MAG: nucleotide transporter 5 [Pseudomonadota bacterium]|jgi:AAA family ATP:ADP antiporter